VRRPPRGTPNRPRAVSGEHHRDRQRGGGAEHLAEFGGAPVAHASARAAASVTTASAHKSAASTMSAIAAATSA
jgi:hypothetical protein